MEHKSIIIVLAFSLTIILSYLFNVIASKTKIPSVLLLIATGIGVHQAAIYFDFKVTQNLQPILEVLGTVGLILIVLEAALDLQLKKENWPVIWKSTLVAILGLGASAAIISAVFMHYYHMPQSQAVLYAVPLSILSSAIIIPSVGGLVHSKKEFMIYESTFSDILGIMGFYVVLSTMGDSTNQEVAGDFFGNLFLTIGISFVISYALVLAFQNINTHVKMFLIIAVLLTLYATAKLQHLSPLLIILIFGLVINNNQLFFRGFLSKWIKQEKLAEILDDFKIITAESAFVVRTFFFVLFGFTVSIASLIDMYVAIISGILLIGIYLSRGILLRVVFGKGSAPMTFIAPRGLITILLFFAIPTEHKAENFDDGILLFVILASSLVMTYALVRHKEPVAEPEVVEAETGEAIEPQEGEELFDEDGLYKGIEEAGAADEESTASDEEEDSDKLLPE